MSRSIRPARSGEHLALTELVLRSVQQCWNYSDEFMAWEPDAITITSEHVSKDITYVLESDGVILGFYVLRGQPPELELLRLMLEPAAIGSGCGRILWDHAVEKALSIGADSLYLDADPNAVPFYERMGAQIIGEHAWEPPMMPGWRLIKMRFTMCPVEG